MTTPGRLLRGDWRTPRRLGALIVGGLALAVGFLPLFGGPGYEFSLACGLLLPGATAIAVALEGASPARAPRAPVDALLRGLGTGMVFSGVAFATALVHGARVGFCDVGGGLLGFVLNPVPGALLGGVWGAYVAERARGARTRRRRVAGAVLLALLGPLAGVAVSLWRFYASPMVFAFDPFVGYFSGTLYDTIIDAGAPLLTYRLGTLATLTCALAVASLLARGPGGGLVPAPRDATTRARYVVAGAAFVASLAVTAFGPELGHYQTPATIARALGAKRSGPRCDVIHPDDVREDEAALLLKDCEEELASVERALGARGPERITAFFFRDAAEKKHLMGAADTYIAKPWRQEVYLQIAPYPHPVLGHEIAHVVAGSFGRGPFRIAGSLGGLLPNPGLIEGIAVAASPDEDELTDETWSRAMMDEGLLPSIEAIFSLGFLGQQAGKSYTVAGAFIRWMMEAYGADKVRAVYGGAPIEHATGKTWRELDDAFRAHLAGLPLSPEVKAYTRAKFDRPAVFGRKCPHVVDAFLREADACRESNRYARADALYDAVSRREPRDFAARQGRALVKLRRGDREGGRADLERIAADLATPRNFRDRAEEAIADSDFMAGAFREATARYRALAARTVDEDAARTLEVKAMCATDPVARAPLVALLLGAPDRAPDAFLSGARVGAWAAQTRDPLADYLLAKNTARKGWLEDAVVHLDRALEAGPPTPRIHRELLRVDAQVACATRSAARLGRVRAALEGPASPFPPHGSGRREAIERLIDRCIVDGRAN